MKIQDLEANHLRAVEDLEQKLSKSGSELQLTKDEAGQVIHKLQLSLQDQISKHAKQTLETENLMQSKCVSLENLLRERKTELLACQGLLKTQTQASEQLKLETQAKSEELVQASKRLASMEQEVGMMVQNSQMVRDERDKFGREVQDLGSKVLELTNLNENHMAQI